MMRAANPALTEIVTVICCPAVHAGTARGRCHSRRPAGCPGGVRRRRGGLHIRSLGGSGAGAAARGVELTRAGTRERPRAEAQADAGLRRRGCCRRSPPHRYSRSRRHRWPGRRCSGSRRCRTCCRHRSSRPRRSCRCRSSRSRGHVVVVAATCKRRCQHHQETQIQNRSRITHGSPPSALSSLDQYV